MGLWGFIKSVGSAIGRGVKKVVEFFSGKKSELGETSRRSSKTFSKSKAYDEENATIEETKKVAKMLEEIRKEYKATLDDIEENTIKYSENIIKKVTGMIETELNQKSEYDPSINPFLQKEALEKEFDKKFEALNINVGEIESKYREAIMSFKRTFSSEILDHIAISDKRCSEILKLNNKSEKEEKEKEIKNYLDELVDNALNNFCFNIDEITKNSLNSIKRNINRVMKNNEESIENIKKEIEENMKLSESEIETKRKEYDRKEKIINNLFETIKL